jgi:hypothetical protein
MLSFVRWHVPSIPIHNPQKKIQKIEKEDLFLLHFHLVFIVLHLLLPTSSTIQREGASLELTYSNWGEQAIQQGDPQTSKAWFNQATDYRKQASSLAPSNYIEVQNWSKIMGRYKV